MKMPSVLHDNIKLIGGWDTSTPTLDLAPGFVRSTLNFECGIKGGYTRIPGYERFDGRPAPSAASYRFVYTSSFTTVPMVGDTITGFTSGATGYVFDVDSVTFRIAVTKTTGVFQIGETIKIGANVVGTSVASLLTVSNSILATIAGLAADVYRADIQSVGGAACTGTAMGYALYKDVIYAFRANAASTAILL